ncbi:hypothetical protein AKJ09_07665 [Labilithrix luteola]|uniref:Uncharacterized protein n=1 Tax=Labilithrix luteola TaxID=1391654 RepID=A0A0K1Q5R4_9BACT|nr:hypothetical protein AKJ09_07665 [Labilithrix luteola]
MATPKSVSALAVTAMLPTVNVQPATAMLATVRLLAATATLPAVRLDPDTATLALALVEPATATLLRTATLPAAPTLSYERDALGASAIVTRGAPMRGVLRSCSRPLARSLGRPCANLFVTCMARRQRQPPCPMRRMASAERERRLSRSMRARQS